MGEGERAEGSGLGANQDFQSTRWRDCVAARSGVQFVAPEA